MTTFRDELRHGWRNLLAATVGIGLGISNYTPMSSLFFRALETEFHWSKAAAAVSLIAFPLAGIATPLAGVLIDRFGIRLIAIVSTLCAAGSYVFLARMSVTLGGFYAGVILLNVLGIATGAVGYTRLVVADFRDARGTALAIALVGIAGSAILLPPLVGWIIRSAGWRVAYDAMAFMTLVGGAIALTLMRPRSVSSSAQREHWGIPLKAAIATRTFWLLGGAIACISVGTIGLVSQFQSIFIEKGLSDRTAALMISVLGLSVVLSRLMVGRLLDLTHPAGSAALAMLVAAVGALILLQGTPAPVAAALAVILIGCSAGAELDLMAFFASRLFGLRHYSSIYGALFSFHYCGIAVGGIGYGVLHDHQGSYAGALGLTAGLLSIAALSFLLLGRVSAPAGENDVEKNA